MPVGVVAWYCSRTVVGMAYWEVWLELELPDGAGVLLYEVGGVIGVLAGLPLAFCRRDKCMR